MISIIKLREVIRLVILFKENSDRQNGRLSQCSHQMVGRIKHRLLLIALDYKSFENFTDNELKTIFYPAYSKACINRPLPDFQLAFQESLKKGKHRKSQTVQFLDYQAKYGDRGYRKTRYFELIREHIKNQRVTMKQQYLPGEMLFIDYAGVKLHYMQRGKEAYLYVFVACLGYSKKLFAFATPDMTSKSWTYALSKALEFYHGVPEVIQFDNAKAMVTKAGRIAVLNDIAKAFAHHYACICDTSRVATPTDNGNAEAAVKFITQRILIPMRSNITFFSQAEVNDFLIREVEKLNSQHFKKLNVSRDELFETQERAALNPLPSTPFKPFNVQKNIQVPSDYLIFHDKHYYSVPYHLVHKKVLVKVTDTEILVLYQNKEVARHKLSREQMGMSRLSEHMKPNHIAEERKNKSVFISWAHNISNDVEQFIEKQYSLTRNPHSRVIGKRCASLQNLCDKCGEEIFSAACHYALEHNIKTPTDLALVIRAKAYETKSEPNALGHQNIRGKEYYEESHDE